MTALPPSTTTTDRATSRTRRGADRSPCRRRSAPTSSPRNPPRNKSAVTGSLPITLKLLPRWGESAIVPIARTSTIPPVIAMPVVNMTRRSSGSIASISARRRSGIPTAPTAARSNPVDAEAAARPTSRALKRCVATSHADQGGGALLSNEEPERREEAPDLRHSLRFSMAEQFF
jgi:hypothetical protein